VDLSIIIPVYNERTKISRDIQEASEFLVENNLVGEIIVVDDGSTDGTAEVAEKTKTPAEVSLRIFRYEINRGKGYAVRFGMIHSQGEWAMFADSGSCVPFRYILTGLQLIKSGECDIAHGSRKLKASIIHRPQKWPRRFFSWIFRWVIILWLKVPAHLTDTQCGFKVYSGSLARQLYAGSVIDGLMFDVEVILRAKVKGLRIKEFPIEWTSDPDSRISLIKNAWPVLKELYLLRKMPLAD